MAQFEVLGTGETVDPTQPVSAAKALGGLLVGASLLFMILNIGRQGGNMLTNFVRNVTGANVDGSGESVTESIGGGF